MDIKIQQDCKHVLVGLMIVHGRYFYGHDVVLVFRILNCFFYFGCVSVSYSSLSHSRNESSVYDELLICRAING